MIRAERALRLLLTHPEYRETRLVLDVGCGEGLHSRAFAEAGKWVTAVDLGASCYALRGKWEEGERFSSGGSIIRVLGDIRNMAGGRLYDLVWASHVLEHQRDPGSFLDLLRKLCKPEGVLAITVPPRKDELVGGHLTCWSPGLLVYHLLHAGLDCREARVASYDYNVSVIVRNRSLPDGVLSELVQDAGDVAKLAPWFPWPNVRERFDGMAPSVNWPDVREVAA